MRSTTSIDAIRPAILKVQRGLSVDFGRTQSEEINNSAQHFAEIFRSSLARYKIKQHIKVARITFCNLISVQIEQKPAFVKSI